MIRRKPPLTKTSPTPKNRSLLSFSVFVSDDFSENFRNILFHFLFYFLKLIIALTPQWLNSNFTGSDTLSPMRSYHVTTLFYVTDYGSKRPTITELYYPKGPSILKCFLVEKYLSPYIRT